MGDDVGAVAIGGGSTHTHPQDRIKLTTNTGPKATHPAAQPWMKSVKGREGTGIPYLFRIFLPYL